MSAPQAEVMRAKLNEAFAQPLDRALASYEGLVKALETQDANDPRADALRHAACRSALQHIAMLMKLAGLAEAPNRGAASGAEADGEKLLQEARRAIAGESGGPS